MVRKATDKLGKYTKTGTQHLSKGLEFANKQLDKVSKAKNAIVGTLFVVALLGAGFIALLIFIIGYVFGLGFKAA